MTPQSKCVQRFCTLISISLAIVVLLFTSCSNDVEPVILNANLIIGSWKWSGSCAMTHSLCWDSDSSTTIKDVYSVDGRFSRYLNNTLIAAAKFESYNDTTHFPVGSGAQGLIIKFFDVALYPKSQWVEYPTTLPSFPTECVFYNGDLTVSDVSNERSDNFARLK